MLVSPPFWGQSSPLFTLPVLLLAQTVGKCLGQSVASTTTAGPPTTPVGRLLHVRDKSNNVTFLVDSGAAVSVLPRPLSSVSSCVLRPSSARPLHAANNSAIRTYGQHHWSIFTSPISVSLAFTSTSLVHCHRHTATLTFSPSSTASLVGHSHFRHHRCDRGTATGDDMNCSFRRPCPHHYRSWRSIRILPFHGTVCSHRLHSPPYHRLPPSRQRYGRKISPTNESFPPCHGQPAALDRTPTPYPSWHSVFAQGRPRLFGSRDGLRLPTSSPW